VHSGPAAHRQHVGGTVAVLVLVLVGADAVAVLEVDAEVLHGLAGELVTHEPADGRIESG
jgi:hypothetical protein